MDDFYGLPIGKLENQHLRLHYLAEAGPRLVRLFLAGSPVNWLAESPEIHWDTPYGRYFLWGGHRLWHAPESLGRSDVPDDKGLLVEELHDGGVRLTQPVESATGVVKSMEVHLHTDHPELTILHGLANQGSHPIELAAWAITQLPLGGTLVLPQPGSQPLVNRLQPDRHLVLWHYTSWQDSRLSISDDYMLLAARPSPESAKWGYLNHAGWIGYFWQGMFLRKFFPAQPQLPHTDLDCNVEFYIKDQYVEMETLGPLAVLAPGERLSHQERWVFEPAPDLETVLKRG